MVDGVRSKLPGTSLGFTGRASLSSARRGEALAYFVTPADSGCGAVRTPTPYQRDQQFQSTT